MAEKLDPKAAMDMTIAQLAAHFGWSYAVVEYLALLYPFEEGEEPILSMSKWKVKEEGRLAEYREAVVRVSANKTLRALVDEFETSGVRPQAIKLRLKEIGLTRIDTFLLPNSTVTLKLLKRLPREDLLNRDATALGTFSANELDNQARSYVDHEVVYGPVLKVKDILASEPSRFRGRGAAKTIRLLEKLGFGPADGPFMAKENDPRKILAKDLVSKNGLTAKEAKKFAEIAAQRNWI